MTNWTECRISEVVSVAQGLCINTKSKHLLSDSGYPLLRITDLINDTEEQYIDKHRVPKKFIAKPDDLIYTRTGQVGYVFKGRVGIVHNNCFRVIPNKEISRQYLFWFLKTVHPASAYLLVRNAC
ncbi:MAG: restriction endonuclease subunit S [Nitrosomonas sp.]|nr:restriction endonuclease subunit S [Nitrosomonas sp.]